MFRAVQLALGLSALALAGCLPGPDLPPARSIDGAEAPGLLPIRDVLRQTADGPNTALLLSAPPEARASALRARAAGLRAPVVGAAERGQMQTRATSLREAQARDPMQQ